MTDQGHRSVPMPSLNQFGVLELPQQPGSVLNRPSKPPPDRDWLVTAGCMHLYVSVCICMYLYVCVCICMYRVCISMHVYVSVCICLVHLLLMW